jgi:hypothetical protein
MNMPVWLWRHRTAWKLVGWAASVAVDYTQWTGKAALNVPDSNFQLGVGQWKLMPLFLSTSPFTSNFCWDMKIQVPSISNTSLGGSGLHWCKTTLVYRKYASSSHKRHKEWGHLARQYFAQGLHFKSHDVSWLQFSLNETSAKSYDVMLFLFEVKHAMHRPVSSFMHTLQAANIIHSRFD